jgi:hypothetical protein
MLKKSDCAISGYDAYILLIAINLHDLGNIGGRTGHEKRVFNHIEDLGNFLGRDSAEKKIIGQIAAVHGGTIKGTKDTIKALHVEENILGQSFAPRFLAALLRFSDELADDQSRAARYELHNKILPNQSVVYHTYSECLSSVVIERDKVRLKFHLDATTATKDFSSRGASPVYLIDEIYNRLLKMHRERLYCMRFLRPKIEITKIDFRIDVDHPSDPLGKAVTITEILEDGGFPDIPSGGIVDLCPGLSCKNGQAICDEIVLIQNTAAPTL